VMTTFMSSGSCCSCCRFMFFRFADSRFIVSARLTEAGTLQPSCPSAATRFSSLRASACVPQHRQCSRHRKRVGIRQHWHAGKHSSGTWQVLCCCWRCCQLA
jgi:hypothetical protein